MILSLNKNLLSRKLAEHFEGSGSKLAARVGVHRSTVARWLGLSPRNLLPRTAEAALSLAAALDLDPIALWDWDVESYPRLIGRVLRAARRNEWTRLLPALSYLDELLLPLDVWPPKAIATREGHRWHFFDAPVSGGESAGRALVSVAPSRGVAADGPQIFYVARRAESLAPSWFGVEAFVLVDAARVRLFALDGRRLDAALPAGCERFTLDLELDRRPGLLRLASLHRFHAEALSVEPTDAPILHLCHCSAQVCLSQARGAALLPRFDDGAPGQQDFAGGRRDGF